MVDSYLFLVLEVIAPMVCVTPIGVKFRPVSVKGSVSKLIGLVRIALLIGWGVFYYIPQKNDFEIKAFMKGQTSVSSCNLL